MAEKIVSITVGYCDFTRAQADELVAIMDMPGWEQLMRVMEKHKSQTAENTLGSVKDKTLDSWGHAQGQFCEANEIMALRDEMANEYQDFIDNDKQNLT